MKEEIRKKILEKRNNLSTYEIFEKSNKIISKLISLEEFKEAKKILCYVSFGSEVYTHGFIKAYSSIKNIAVPVVNKEKNELILSCIRDWKELSTGAYGILEPKKIKKANPKEIEIAIIPGIAFDKRGYRIGYGEGYFDRLLSKMNAIRIAIAYELQIVNKIPDEKHDMKMDKIITEKRILSFHN